MCSFWPCFDSFVSSLFRSRMFAVSTSRSLAPNIHRSSEKKNRGVGPKCSGYSMGQAASLAPTSGGGFCPRRNVTTSQPTSGSAQTRPSRFHVSPRSTIESALRCLMLLICTVPLPSPLIIRNSNNSGRTVVCGPYSHTVAPSTLFNKMTRLNPA